jgi:membrane protein insertase Oxa1/YidC/SpoIIIJ
LKKYFASFLYKLNAASIAIAGYIILSLFSLWYVANVKARISRDNNISRVTTINDESNKMRFFANAVTMGIIYSAPFDDKVLFGMGSIENFTNATKGEVIMPHNEIFDAIVEYGIISVILFSILSFSFFNKVTSYSNLEYYIPIVFHTLILYVRILIVPSFEMLFILFLLFIVRKQEKLKPALRFN